jgi:ASC-1-like (ASCH) protein
MIHTMRLQRKHFDKIKSGEKTVELRVYDEKRRNIKYGHTIIFESRDDAEIIERQVCDIAIFSDFYSLLDVIAIDKTGYAADEKEKLIYDLATYYCADDISRWGVVAITVK